MNPYFSSRHLEATAGGEFKAVLKDKIVFDATVNPDFSDIESDQPQFTVNQRYPVYFPGAAPVFSGERQLLHHALAACSALHPQYRASGVWRARDRQAGPHQHRPAGHRRPEPGETVSPGDPLYKKRAFIAVGRVSQDLRQGIEHLRAVYRL